MREIKIWPLCVEAYHAISRYYVPVMDEKAVECQLPEGGGWLLLPALTFDPEPVSAEKLRIRSPYTSARRYQAGLDNLAMTGFLISESGKIQAYRLSPLGREAILAVIQAGYDCMQTLQPLHPAELESLATALLRLVSACLEAPEPPEKWSIIHSRKIDPGKNAAGMIRIDQYLSDLAAYRDDSHLAAWQGLDIEGHACELLTVLWRDGANQFEDLATRLANRGFTSGETQAALSDLVDRRWVKIEEEFYSLTDLGKGVRNDAEDETDFFFYQPWSCLSEQELREQSGLITSLKDELQAGC